MLTFQLLPVTIPVGRYSKKDKDGVVVREAEEVGVREEYDGTYRKGIWT